ncbi:14795_t:CDS:10, partial [Acaulospora morrowiae]
MSEVTPLLKNRPGSDPSYGQNSSYSDASFAHDSRKKAQNAHSSSMAHAAEMERIRKSQKTFFKHAESKPNLRQRIAYQCDTGKRGRIWELVDATLSVMFFSLYIWNTQYVLPDHNPIPFPHSLQTADMVLACLILVQFLPRVWLDNEPLQYAGNFFSTLTWVSVFPVIFAYIQTIYDTEMDNTYMGVEKYVRKAHVSVQMLFVPARNSLFHFSVITRKGLKIGVTILFTFLTVAAWIHIISFKQITSHLDLSFYDAFCEQYKWYEHESHTREQLDAFGHPKSKYDHGFKRKKGHQHVLVTGDFNSTSLFEFLREFFCQDHGLATVNTYVVILNPEEPPDDVVLLLEDPAFVNRVQYVKGSSAFRRSLVKAKAESASAAFLLAPKFTKNDDEIDAAQLMRSLALKKYNNNLPLYVQVHLPENISHFDFLAEGVICIDELTMGLMAQSLVTPGFTSLVVLLTTSVTDKVANELTRNATRQEPELMWATEYIRGMQQEIYAVELSEFQGKTFLECSELIYVHLHAVLFSIGTCKTSEKTFSTLMKDDNSSHFQIYLNPQDYMIKGNEIGFVISDDASIVSGVAQFNHKKNKQFDPYLGMQFLHSTKSFFQLNRKDENVDKVNSDLERNGTNEDYSTIVISASPPSTQVPEPSNIIDESESISMLLKSDTERSEVLRKNIEKAKAYWDKPIDNGIEEVRNHVLICNCSNLFPENLDIFVMTLRERNSSCRDMP